ncbi:unnamed protein product [Schistosoma margrebowiei]|uniref:Uncharacterized protein n=1 Tax=Schistosoma margrebowiei TaxID=48269 RepID=A0A183MU51_9TREM|nr:unnamed protein product [Schistosoma margrebowiei]
MEEKTTSVAAAASTAVSLNIYKGKGKILRYNEACTNRITLDGEALEDAKTFTCLGSIIDEHGGSDSDIKVRARENERRLLTELTYGKVSEARRAIYCRLPLIITQVWSILRPCNARPLPLSTVAVRVADSHPSGLSADAISEHLDVLLELAPCWIEKLNWSIVHLRLKDPGRSVKDVIDMIKLKVAKDGVNI